MLLGARSHQEVGQGQAMLAGLGKLTLGRGGDGEGLGVHAKWAESVECDLEVTVVGRRSRAEEHFETRDGAYAPDFRDALLIESATRRRYSSSGTSRA